MSHAPTPADDADVPVKNRVSRRLAFWTGGAAVVLGVAALTALRPYQQQEAEKVAADHIGLLAEAVAASYEQDVPAKKPPEDEIERELDEKDVEREHVHRAREMLAQLQRADGVVAIDVADHTGKVRQSTRAQRISTRMA